MPWKLAACGCLIALLVVACQSDSDSVTGVDRTLDHHERGNCHFAPAASITQDAGDELVTIEFTYGGGEIFAGPESDCDENSGPDIEGTLLASHGVSYGDTVGTHGTFLAIEQCETRMFTPCAYDLPSAPNAMWIDALFGLSGYLRFDPPISELSFQVCSTQQHAMAAWDSLGNLVVSDTIGPSGVDGPEGGCDAGWLPFKISTSGYDISRVRLRRFDPGYTFWDDMTFRREAEPALDCTEVEERGNETTCTILRQLQPEDSVVVWRFEGSIPGLDPLAFDTTLAEEQWSGRAALQGRVSVDVKIDDSLHTFSDTLIVQPRNLSSSPWRWDDDKWDYVIGGGERCHTYVLYHLPGAVTLAENSSTESCLIQTFTPRTNDVEVIDSTFVADSIFDGGPNHGLFFVDSALFAMEHGSYYNPSIRPDTAGSPVTSADNLKDCKEKQLDSLSLNLHEFNLQCTKPPERNEFLAWWAAVENHEGYGTPGHGPDDNGHQAQREIAAALPENDPYAIVEPLVAASRQDLHDRLGTLVWGADEEIAAASGNHDIVRENWGTWDPSKGTSCGNIYVYWTDVSPAEYARTYVCEAKDEDE